MGPRGTDIDTCESRRIIMSSSILDTVMGLLGPKVSGALASHMGESSDTIQRGLEGGAAAMLSGVVSKADEPGFLNQIFGMLTGPQMTGALSGLISNPAAAVTG